jgi:hypothetical protein
MTNDEYRMTNGAFVIRKFVIRHFLLAVDRGEAPIGDHDFSARRDVADLAGNLDLLALGGFAKFLFQFVEFLGAFAPPANFFFAFADAHREVEGPEFRVEGLGKEP